MNFAKGLNWLVFIIVLFACGSQEARKSAASDKQKFLRVNANTLWRDYQDNQIAAEARYGDKILEVKGRVLDIGRVDMYSFFVNLKADSGLIQCIFDEKFENQLARLRKNDTVRVRGWCWYFGNDFPIRMSECSLH